MRIKEAAKLLQENGWDFIRMGRGSHRIFRKGDKTIILGCGTNGSTELSNGMALKVKSACRK
jgi:predicted RNA binding protein YcfA (HicA-like mRNA interferase family)